MIDVISLSIAIGAIIVGILSHIRHSECYGIKIDTRTPTKSSPPNSPNLVETQPLLHNSPAILEVTQPIDIPPRPKPKIKNWL
jgi:hypothetical protein